MKWFKHDTGANMDAKLQEVLLDYGLEGYGLYWYCLELISGKIEKENVQFKLEHDARIIARNTGSTVQKVQDIMNRFVELRLFEQSDGDITCFKLAKRLDQSMTSNPAMRQIINTIKQSHDYLDKSHDSVMMESSKPMQDKTRLDKNRLDKKKTKTIVAHGLDFTSLKMTEKEILEIPVIRKKNKGSAITQRMINGLAKEFDKARVDHNMTNDDILTEWESRGWKSFKSEWVKSSFSNQQKEPDFDDNSTQWAEDVITGKTNFLFGDVNENNR